MNRNELQKNWTSVKEKMRDEYGITDVSYDTWIKDLTLQSISGNQITIAIPSDNPMMLSYLNNRYKDIFTAALSEELGEMMSISFVLNSAVNEEDNEEPSLKSALAHAENANLNAKYRFDTYVVGSNNRLAHSACLAVAESPGGVYNPLFLYGGAGLGKTHLMHSIGHFVLEQNPDKKVLYVTSEQFTNEVIESIRSGNAASMAKLRDKYRTVDVLLIDDIQFIIGKESTQEEFFHTFNELHAAGKQIVLSSDRPPREMETLNERFRSRFEMGLIADIQPPDYETRMAILRRNMELQHNKLDDNILEYIASNIKSNIRELEGAYNKIIAYSKLNRVEITLENAREALKDIIYPDEAHTITPKLIAAVVCDHYGVKMSMVASRKKNAECVVPRQVIMYLCREYTNETLDSIARLLGKKDHSTIMHGVDKIRSEINTNSELKANIDILKNKLGVSE
ncbi:MAG: chromosomal replication initiator protein DnaA [Lachnospiraceae bacterium]|nr:chromosomal replication initiator protein DnaA [Lachnospiraceae bacterium]